MHPTIGLVVVLEDARAILLFGGHIGVAIAYLGIAYFLRELIASIDGTAEIVTRMFRLFSWFICGCGIQHAIAATLFVIGPVMLWPYIASVWITAILALITLGFMWWLRPRNIPPRPIVVVPS